MHLQRPYATKRSGFTLVELMVVILIITVLSALLAMAVSRAMAAGKRTRNQIEIRQLAAAVDAFKTAYKVDYIPSSIFLSENGAAYSGPAANAPLYRDSLAYLQRIWPRLNFTNPNGGIDWNGNGKIDPPTGSAVNGDVILTGDQCLVFFLGGIPNYLDPLTGLQALPGQGLPSCTGFSTNPGNPAAHVLPQTPGLLPKPPLYEFDSGRLVRGYNPNAPLFFSYLDTYGNSTDGKGTWASGTGQPYLYFSSYQGRNGYNHFGIVECQGFDPNANVLKPVYPYAQGVNQYLNPSGFQIISAGADKLFGPGSANPSTSGASGGPFWSPATAGTSAASGVNGADDQSSFYDSLLGNSSIN
jgi:prepilin-type N-terminal cleavage/methylation domain-containing protein